LRLLSAAIFLALLVPLMAPAAEVVNLAEPVDGVSAVVVESQDGRTVIEYRVGSFRRGTVEIDGEAYDTIGLGDESRMKVRGLPELPDVARSIIVPDDAEMAVRIVSSHYVDIQDFRVAPSKGTILRNVDPSTVAHTFGEFYGSDEWYPRELAYGREPYIMRDHRGMVVVVNPFQYNHATSTLRVYDRVVVAVERVGPGKVNVLEHRPNAGRSTEFSKIYEDHFLNFDQAAAARYASLDEIGNMLVIAYNDFMPAMAPFVEWKNQMGVACEMVSVTDVGVSSPAISAYIQDYYDTNGLTYVLLVGDADQIPTPYAAGGSSDPSYSLTAGSDTYPDLFVGRFSAEEVSHVETQVLRTIEYEKFPQAGAPWYHQGTGVASNQGPGDDGEYDNEHSDFMRDDLLAFTYTEVDQIYDPSASASDVSTALNDGRSIVNYTGHGSTMGWGSSGFSNSYVNALTNDDKLPFIISVACVNGYFNGITCFAEVWLRATNGAEPTGAIGTYMSSINQSWDPPMSAQDEVVDLLVAGAKRTFGGLCYNGSALMIDEYGPNGEDMFLSWHIFGDPSLRVRTDVPTDLTVVHDGEMSADSPTYKVTVVGVEGALCALYLNGTLYGAGLSGADGVAVIDVLETPPTDEDLTLTVTAFNANPHFGTVHVGQVFVPAIQVAPEFFDVVLETGQVQVETFQITNAGEPQSVLSFTIEVVDAGTPRELDSSTMGVAPSAYEANQLEDFVFTISNESTQDEWINAATIDFPEGMLVMDCTNFVVGSRELVWDGATGDGAESSWSATWENVIYPGETAQATVTVFSVPMLVGNQELTYTLSGDSWGTPPQTVTGTLVLEGPEGPSVTLVSPNGGEMWGLGELHDISWSSVGEFDVVSISCSVDGGETWFDVAAETPNDGVHTWLVDGPISTECLMRVTAATVQPAADTSDGTFAIYQPVTWLTVVPESGDIEAGGTADIELTFSSEGLAEGDYYAELLIDSNGGDRQVVPVALHVSGTSIDETIPDKVELYGNYPNPFNPLTRIAFALPEAQRVAVTVYDVRGRVVRNLADEVFEPGPHEIPWDGTNEEGSAVASGIYFYRFESASVTRISKMVLMK
jgi:hypothetical protein